MKSDTISHILDIFSFIYCIIFQYNAFAKFDKFASKCGAERTQYTLSKRTFKFLYKKI